MPNRAITLRDVAAAAGVHVSTASKALDASKERLVNAETRSRVRAAADGLGYRPHLLARGLRRGRTGMVGVVLPDIGNPYVALLVRGIREVLEKSDVTPIIAETDDDSSRLERVLDGMASHRVDGVIVGCARLGDEQRLLEFDQQLAPVVLAVRRLPGSGLPAFSADDLAGGRLAAGYLLGLGHRRIAQFEGPSDVQPFLDRGSGFRHAAAQHSDVEVLELSERAEHPTYDEGRRLMHLLIAAAPPRPTGLFAHNDTMALGAISALRAAGLRCPGDMSVVGFNDIPLAFDFSPPLTTIRTESEAIGRLAAEALLARLTGGGEVGDACLAPALVPRRSTRRVAAAQRESLKR